MTEKIDWTKPRLRQAGVLPASAFQTLPKVSASIND